MKWSASGALMLALAVALGAFGAHALKARFDAYSMGIWEKAVFYHFVHALGLLIIPVFGKLGAVSQSAATKVSMLLLAGIVLFSGSLYTLALTGVTTLGAVTPLGGISFIAAWCWLGYAITTNKA